MNNDTALRNAREKALLEEEKWLIESLKKIRMQRNALRVEQLYFQGLKADLLRQHCQKFDEENKDSGINNSENGDGNSHSRDARNDSFSQNSGGESYSQNASSSFENTERDWFSPIEEESEPIPEPVGRNPLNFDDFNSLEEQCNETESLDLNVPDSKPGSDMEQEYDSEEEEGEWNQIPFDMGLFVGGHCNQYEDDNNE